MWLDLKLDPRRRRASGVRRCCLRRPTAGHKLFLERLEDRTIPSVAPLPIPSGFLIPNPFGGPDVHFHQPGPADSTSNRVGGEPSTLNDFNGFVGVAHVQGTGTDDSGNTLLWDTDMRLLTGVYQGVDGNLHRGTFAFI